MVSVHRLFKLLSPRGHALLDYLTAPALLLAAPRLRGPASTAAHGFAALILLAVTTTKTPLGIIRVVPFRWHGRAELASVFVQFALPWLAGCRRQKRERRFWLAFALYNLLVWLGTDWTAGE